MLDYIVVGSGLAGISFAETLFKHNKTFVMFDNNFHSSTKVAGGLYNPVVLKRFSEVWNAKHQLEFANDFYQNLEIKLQSKFDYKIPIYRKFFSVEEQNNWFAASDKPILTNFLSTKLIFKEFEGINSPFGYGEVLQSGYVDTDKLLECYHQYLKEKLILKQQTFDYSELKILINHVSYFDLIAKHIVFAEGFGMHKNPYFNYLPLDGTKGELLIIKAKNLNIDVIINTSIFILPIGNDLFKVGATYNWKDKSSEPTEEGKSELLEKINEIINCDFEVVDHFAGVRPTVNDRRPLLGSHPNFKNLHILNGLGTRGVMLAPSMALDLFEYIENDKPLDKTIDIKRYQRFFDAFASK